MIEFTVNGQKKSVDADPQMPLLWALRDHLDMTGTKYGCGIGSCGACTIHVDGMPARACQTSLADAAGRDITTIEGANGKVAQAVQSAWQKLDVVQCGYCQSGQIMSAIALLSQTPKPTDEEITNAMDGNVCRCATYQRIRAAIHEAAQDLGR
jgi:isoquinoline 1-oxidoreductase alpha subunit